MKVVFFPSAADFRNWPRANGETGLDLWVGSYKKTSAKPSITYPEAVDEALWDFFQSQPPWYRRTATFWVISAKKEETRQRRLATLMADSERGKPIKPLVCPVSRKGAKKRRGGATGERF